jgi:hypothetical protein
MHQPSLLAAVCPAAAATNVILSAEAPQPGAGALPSAFSFQPLPPIEHEPVDLTSSAVTSFPHFGAALGACQRHITSAAAPPCRARAAPQARSSGLVHAWFGSTAHCAHAGASDRDCTWPPSMPSAAAGLQRPSLADVSNAAWHCVARGTIENSDATGLGFRDANVCAAVRHGPPYVEGADMSSSLNPSAGDLTLRHAISCKDGAASVVEELGNQMGGLTLLSPEKQVPLLLSSLGRNVALHKGTCDPEPWGQRAVFGSPAPSTLGRQSARSSASGGACTHTLGWSAMMAV